MTAVVASFNNWTPEEYGTQLPASGLVPLQALAQVGRGQFATYDASGYAALNDGTMPGLICAGVGYPSTPSDVSPLAGRASLSVWTGYGGQAPASTISGDGFTQADTCTPAWIASENALGRRSNYLGANRSLAGLVVSVSSGLAPRAWVGPIAQAVARGVLIANAYPLAETSFTDAAASTTTVERAITRPKIHGTVTSIEFAGAAIAADNTDYATITISRRDGAGGAAVVLGTYDTRAANQGAVTAFVPALFSLSLVSGVLNLLETDIVTIATTKGGAGKALVGSVLVNGKAI